MEGLEATRPETQAESRKTPNPWKARFANRSKLRLPRYCGGEVIVCPRCPPYAVDRLVVLNGRITVPL